MYRILKENSVQNTYLEDQARDVRIISRWILIKQSVRGGKYISRGEIWSEVLNLL